MPTGGQLVARVACAEVDDESLDAPEECQAHLCKDELAVDVGEIACRHDGEQIGALHHVHVQELHSNYAVKPLGIG